MQNSPSDKMQKFVLVALLGVLFGFLWSPSEALDRVDYKNPSQSRGLTQSEKDHILELHNKYREVTAKGQFFNKPQAANMMKMVI